MIESGCTRRLWDEILRIIREEDPPKPSTRLSDAEGLVTFDLRNRHTEPSKLTKLVRGELDWIVMKALEKDRNRRYEAANGFAMDVLRYLNDEQVQACPPSAAYRFGKFARRNRVALSTTALVFATLVLGICISIWQAIRAIQAEDLAETRLVAETKAKSQALTSQTEAERQSKRATGNEKRAKEQEALAQRRFYASQINLAHRRGMRETRHECWNSWRACVPNSTNPTCGRSNGTTFGNCATPGGN